MMAPFLGMEKVLSSEPGRRASAAGRLPLEAPFFSDHFPAFPVLPGVLALEILKRTAELCLENPSKAVLKKVSQVKFSSYLKPGESWESRVELAGSEGRSREFKAKLFQQDRLAVSARILLEVS